MGLRRWKPGGDVEEVVLPRAGRAWEAVQSHNLRVLKPILGLWLGVSASRLLGPELDHVVAPLTR